MFQLQKGKSSLGVFGVGLPASIQNLLNVTGMTILNNFTSSFGANAVAAMGIAQKINHSAVLHRRWVSSQGIMPLVSYTYSSRRHRPHEAHDSRYFAEAALCVPWLP